MDVEQMLEQMVTNAHTVRILRGSTRDMVIVALQALKRTCIAGNLRVTDVIEAITELEK